MKALIASFALVIAAMAAFAATKQREEHAQVTLVSDGRTWVSVSGTMVPAQFKTKTVALSPGEYEAVGRRVGYWDVKQKFVVMPDRPLPVVHIVCTLTAEYWPDGTPKK